jgi:uncharacterized membrane protein
MAAAPASLSNIKQELSLIPKRDTIGFIAFIAGIIILVSGLTAQFFIIDHGTSGQLTIQNQLNKALWCILLAVVLGIVGYVLWIMYAKDHNRYLQTFLMAFFSLIIGNAALLTSLYQVQVSPV